MLWILIERAADVAALLALFAVCVVFVAEGHTL
jgi:hypothetical protein